MAELPKNELSARATSICEQVMDTLVDADLFSEPANDSSQWNPILHRLVFSQTTDVWRGFDDIEVELSPEGNITRFKDNNRFINAFYYPMPESDILSIAGTTGFVGNRAAVDRIAPGPKGMLVADVSQHQAGFPDAIQFTINPTTRQVAAFEVKRMKTP